MSIGPRRASMGALKSFFSILFFSFFVFIFLNLFITHFTFTNYTIPSPEANYFPKPRPPASHKRFFQSLARSRAASKFNINCKNRASPNQRASLLSIWRS
ncbi:hypothetical protein TsFJ059_005121 [Trichoderma semiorbis]|uniref:Uncharacterized protein n=1 Tax=Trichoderma semiorbis TaxID=1491008 RepID=A0A9P8HT29_9HYPO|nr:hypothetical protein TsFJ059_005121 [Trichoderma semiorbis]